MHVDQITLKDIGLFQQEEGRSIAEHINFTRTSGGKIQLEKYLAHPLSSISHIQERQDAILLFQQDYVFLQAMQITNGTVFVMDKYFETGVNYIPHHPGLLQAYWYQFWNQQDYALLSYSVSHFTLFIQELKKWILQFETKPSNPVIQQWIQKMQPLLSNVAFDSLPVDAKNNSMLQNIHWGHFFLYQYKTQTRLLLQYYYEIDAIYSMAIAMQKFHWVFPTWIASNQPLIQIEAARHPLLEHPIGNHLNLDSQQNLLFLTGANMAGKSTYIKTIGLVVYFAHVGMGAPVSQMKLTLMDGLISNLTIADNITKGESYFFNEVQRIKNTVEKIKDGKKYCVLIDELFKGTNIQDAMKCSIKVIEGLQKLRHSLIILSTHLYEISDAISIHPNIQFSYFETQITQKELVFHYQLKPGVSQDRIGYLILEREGVVDLLDHL